jgi:hypothetical protein
VFFWTSHVIVDAITTHAQLVSKACNKLNENFDPAPNGDAIAAGSTSQRRSASVSRRSGGAGTAPATLVAASAGAAGAATEDAT